MTNKNLCPHCSSKLDGCESCCKTLCLCCDQEAVQDDDGLCFCADCVKEMSLQLTQTVDIQFKVNFSEDMTFTQAEWELIEAGVDSFGCIKEHSKAFDLIMSSMRTWPLDWVDKIEVDIETQ